jgi:prepilin peptidase CpaA
MHHAAPALTAAWIVLLAIPAAVTDARHGVIPNGLTVPSLATAPLVAWALAGAAGASASLAGMLVSGLVPLILFRSGAGGGGDVKLLAAIGAIGGVRLGLEIQLASFVLATAWAFVVLARRGQLAPTLARALRLVARPLLTASRNRSLTADAGAMTAVRLGPAVLAASITVLGAWAWS